MLGEGTGYETHGPLQGGCIFRGRFVVRALGHGTVFSACDTGTDVLRDHAGRSYRAGHRYSVLARRIYAEGRPQGEIDRLDSEYDQNWKEHDL